MKTRKPTQSGRRSFIKTLGGATAAMAALPALASGQAAAPRKAGAKYMGDFAAPKLPKVRIAMIGVGARGTGPRVAARLDRGHGDRRHQRPVRGSRQACGAARPGEGPQAEALLRRQEPLPDDAHRGEAGHGGRRDAVGGARAHGRGGHAGRRPHVHRDAHRRHHGRDVAARERVRGDGPPLHAHGERVLRAGGTALPEHGPAGRHRRAAARRSGVHPRPARPDEAGGARHRLVAHVPLHQAQRQPLPVPRPRPGRAVHEPRAHRGHLRPPRLVLVAVEGRARCTRRPTSPPTTSGTRRRSSPATSTRRSSRPRSAGRSWSSGTSSPRARTRATT